MGKGAIARGWRPGERFVQFSGNEVAWLLDVARFRSRLRALFASGALGRAGPAKSF